MVNGNNAHLTANLTSNGIGLAGKLFRFLVDGNLVGSNSTDINGNISYYYPVWLIGGWHVLNAEFLDDGNYSSSSDSTVLNVSKASTDLTLSDLSGHPGDNVTLTANLTSNSSPLAAQNIIFLVDGTVIGSNSTNAGGIAVYNYIITLNPGDHAIEAQFTDDNYYLNSNGSNNLTVIGGTVLVFDDVIGVIGQNVNLTATLSSNGTLLTGRTIYFKVNGVDSGNATADINGIAIKPYNINLVHGNYTIFAYFNGEIYYLASNGTANLTVGNSAPLLDPIGDKTVDDYHLLQFTVTATDSDGDTLTYSATGLPSGASLDPITGVFSWTPIDQAGIYPFTFIVSDGYLNASENIKITVNDIFIPPVADFTASPISGNNPLNVVFTDLSTGNITSWAWDFNNDGIVDSNLQNPNYVYNTPGTYTVNLTVNGPAGNENLIKTGYIVVNSASVPVLTSSRIVNYGAGAVYYVLIVRIVNPDGGVEYKQFEGYLDPGSSQDVDMGSYPPKTKFSILPQIWNRSYNAGIINLVIEVYVKGSLLATYPIYKQISPLLSNNFNNLQGEDISSLQNAPDVISTLSGGNQLLNGGTITMSLNNILSLLNLPGMESLVSVVTVLTSSILSLIQELSSESPVIQQVEQYFSMITNIGNYLNSLLNM